MSLGIHLAAVQTNTFQLVLGWNGRETFAQFLYADDGIQWIAGEGKTAHHADARGQAGLISGDGRYTQLRHSGTDQVRHLDRSVTCRAHWLLSGTHTVTSQSIEGSTSLICTRRFITRSLCSVHPLSGRRSLTGYNGSVRPLADH